MSRTAALVVVLAAAVIPTRAEACSCGGGPNVWPQDGATEVPANVRLLVIGIDLEPVSLRHVSDGATVMLDVEDQTAIEEWTTLALRPQAPLELGVYEIRVGDVLVSTFATGTDTDETAPVFAGATTVTPQRFRSTDSHDSCWSIDGVDEVRLEHAPLPSDAVGLVAVLRRQDEPAPFWRGMHPVFVGDAARETRFSTNVCSWAQLPPLDAGVTYCARLSAFDFAGNEAGADVETCGLTRECFLEGPIDEPREEVCEPSPQTPSQNGGGGCAAGGRPSAPGPLGFLALGALLLGTAVSRRPH